MHNHSEKSPAAAVSLSLPDVDCGFEFAGLLLRASPEVPDQFGGEGVEDFDDLGAFLGGALLVINLEFGGQLFALVAVFVRDVVLVAD